MSNLEIRALLERLQEEIRNTELDAETRALVRDLDADIHGLIESGEDADTDSLLERTRELEANFATTHPTAARVVGEVIDMLARMGI